MQPGLADRVLEGAANNGDTPFEDPKSKIRVGKNPKTKQKMS